MEVHKSLEVQKDIYSVIKPLFQVIKLLFQPREPIYPLYNLVFKPSIKALISFKSQGRWTCAGHDRVGLVMSRSKVCMRPRSQVKLGRHVGYWSRVTGRPSDMNLYPIQALCRDLLSRMEVSSVHSLKTHQGSHEIREVL